MENAAIFHIPKGSISEKARRPTKVMLRRETLSLPTMMTAPRLRLLGTFREYVPELAGDGGVVVEFADGDTDTDTGMAYEGKVWKLNPM